MKKRTFVMAGIAVVLLVIGIVAVNKMENNKTNPVENYTQKNTGNNLSDGDYLSEPDSKIIKNGVAEFVHDDPIINQNVVHTFLAYDFVEGSEITNQTEYSLENFDIPIVSEGEEIPETISIPFFDWERLEKDNQEFYTQYLNRYNGDYSDEEIERINNQFSTLSEEYETLYEYEISYVFFKCQFENTSGGENEINLANMRIMLTNEDYSGYQWGEICYFDKSQHTGDAEDMKSYYVYTLQPGETLECVIGAYIYKNGTDTTAPELNNLYFGYEDLEVYNSFVEGLSPYSPIYGKSVFKVSDLKEM